MDETLIAEPVPTPLEEDLHERLAATLAALPAALQGVVVWHDVEGYTHQEIAAALGITVGASKVRLSRARAQLRLALADVWARTRPRASSRAFPGTAGRW